MADRQRKWVRAVQHEAVIAVLKQAREHAGLTQRDMATKLGVAQSMVGKLETGERNLSLIEFIAWAKALDLDVHDLLNRIL